MTDSDSVMSGISIDKRRPLKRKKEKTPSPDDSLEDNSETSSTNKIKIKLRNRRRFEEKDSQEEKKDVRSKKESDSDTENPLCTTEAEDKRRKVGRPKKRKNAVNPDAAEKLILQKTGQAPDKLDLELLKAMTATDISAQAFEYLEDIELIRTKCGRLQGGLSGELKKRTQCLEEIIRSLQHKADAKGDPDFLKCKIEELLAEIRRSKTDDEKRQREIKELQEIIQDLKKENKSIREEMRNIRDSISVEYKPKSNIKSSVKSNLKTNPKTKTNLKTSDYTRSIGYLPKNVQEEKSHAEESHAEDPGPSWMEDEWPLEGHRWLSDEDPKTEKERSREKEKKEEEKGRGKGRTSIVLRPLIGGRKTPIPNTLLTKEEKMALLKRAQEAQKRNQSMPVIKKIEEVNAKIKIILTKEEERIEKKTGIGKETEWTEVVRRGSRKKNRSVERKDKEEVGNNKNRGKGKEKEVRRRIPKSSAISIKGSSQNFSYAEALKKARNRISLQELEIDAPRIRKGMNGSTIIEIDGKDHERKANLLANKIQEVLREEALVTRPSIKGEIKLIGLEESIDAEEIEYEIAKVGNCDPKEIRVTSIKETRSGLGIAWTKCPIQVAIKLSKEKKIKIGWTVVKAELLRARPLQCYRCWRVGHTKDTCKSDADYSKLCFQCGKSDHKVSDCKNRPNCILCTKLNVPSNHRVGSINCQGIFVNKKFMEGKNKYTNTKVYTNNKIKEKEKICTEGKVYTEEIKEKIYTKDDTEENNKLQMERPERRSEENNMDLDDDQVHSN